MKFVWELVFLMLRSVSQLGCLKIPHKCCRSQVDMSKADKKLSVALLLLPRALGHVE